MFGTTVGFGGGALNGARGLITESTRKAKKKTCKVPKGGVRKSTKKGAMKESSIPTGLTINNPVLKPMPTLAVIQPKYRVSFK